MSFPSNLRLLNAILLRANKENSIFRHGLCTKTEISSLFANGSLSPKTEILPTSKNGSLNPKTEILPPLANGSLSTETEISPTLKSGSFSPKTEILSPSANGSLSTQTEILPTLKDGSLSPKTEILPPLANGSLSPKTEILPTSKNGSLSKIHISPEDMVALQKRGMSAETLHEIAKTHHLSVDLEKGGVAAKLDALEQLGFDRKNIPRGIKRCPTVLRYDPETFKPLLQQLESLDMEKSFLRRILTYIPRALERMGKDGVQFGNVRMQELLQFLLDHGISKAEVERILGRYPLLLVFTSLGKMERVVQLLKELGIDDQSICRIIKRYPAILTRSHDKNLQPKLDFLRGLGVDDKNLRKIIARYPQMMGFSFEHSIKPSIAYLQNAGLKGDALVRMLVRIPQILAKSVHKPLGERADFFSGLGFDKKTGKFTTAMCLTASLSLENLKARFEQLLNLGLSKSEVRKILKSQPQVFKQSGKDIENKVEFLVKHMEQPITMLATAPAFLLYSLEKRIKPRSAFMSHLYSSEKLTKMYRWSTIMTMSERRFNEAFVKAYPEVGFLYKSHKPR